MTDGKQTCLAVGGVFRVRDESDFDLQTGPKFQVPRDFAEGRGGRRLDAEELELRFAERW